MTMKIVNSEKMIAREIMSAPAFMLPREFTQNGMENHVKGTNSLVRWDIVEVGGIKKLAVIDNGQGMSKADIDVFTTTIGASMGDKDGTSNHGVGARYSGLHSNPMGMVYYTKTKGGPIYTFKLSMTKSGPDCTKRPEVVKSAPFDLGEHGTAVVFLGESKAQDTTKEVYRDSKRPIKNKLMRTLTERYFRLPSKTRVEFARELTATQDRTRKLVPLYEHMKSAPQYEAVKLGGLTIHYALFAEKKDKRQALSGVTFGGLGGVIWDGEVYQLEEKVEWQRTSSTFRIEAIQERTWIFVEMDKLAKDVMASTHRDQLIWMKPQNREGYEARARHVRIKNFRMEIAKTMPAWMADAAKQEEIKEDEKEMKEARKHFMDQLRDMQATMPGLKHDKNGDETGLAGEGETFSERKTDRPLAKSAPANVLPFPDGSAASKQAVLAEPPRIEVSSAKMEAPVLFLADAEVEGRYIITLYEEHKMMAVLKAELKRMLQMEEVDFQEWWLTSAQNAAMYTFTKHYLASIITAGMGYKEEAKGMLEMTGALAAMSHIGDFKAIMRKKAKLQQKKVAV